MKLYKKFIEVLLLSVLSISLYSLEKLMPVEEEFGGGLIAGRSNSCLDMYNNEYGTNYKVGRNERPNNNWFFLGLGEADIKAPIDSPNYINSSQNAFTLASIRAKQQLAEFLGKDIKDEISSVYIESVIQGKEPIEYAKAKARNENNNIADYSLIEKAMAALHKKLDNSEAIRSVENDFSKLEEIVNDVLNQDTFRQTIETSASYEIRGMKNIYISHTGDSSCVLSIFSSKTRRWADAIGSNNFSSIKNIEKKGKPLSEIVPDKKKSEGLAKLFGLFGTFIEIDNLGQLQVISFAQAGSTSENKRQILAARNIAIAKAEAQIAQFREEAVDVFNKVENIEINTTYVDDFKEYYSENNYLERVNSSSRLALSGLETYDWWATKHPITKKPVVGVVVTWTPNASENSSKINKELKQQPDF